MGHFSHRLFAEYLMMISLYTMSSALCVLLNFSFLLPAISKAELLKNFRGRNPVQYIHCTIQRNNFASYPLRILHFQVLWVLLSICNLSLGGGFSNNWHSCMMGGVLVCQCIYLCDVYVCVCVLVWKGWDWHDTFPWFFLIFQNLT